jgi:predicted metal-binding membrane protein
MQEGTTLEAVLRRDRLIVLAGLVGISALAWAYLGYMAWEMEAMNMAMQMAMPHMRVWSAVDILLLFVMWVVMMVAMMVPTAASMILTYAVLTRQQQTQPEPFAPTVVFLGGYLVVWTGFSALATLAQWGLHEAALLSPMMVSTSPVLGGVLLLSAGIFQWTPWKYTCLKHCRSPLGFLMTDWREGTWGALWMGLRHGSYCMGCCWFLMALLFIAGVMNLLWVATITAFILVEKMVPRGDLVGRVAGGVLVLTGIILLS